jgi:hypothetical protein
VNHSGCDELPHLSLFQIVRKKRKYDCSYKPEIQSQDFMFTPHVVLELTHRAPQTKSSGGELSRTAWKGKHELLSSLVRHNSSFSYRELCLVNSVVIT